MVLGYEAAEIVDYGDSELRRRWLKVGAKGSMCCRFAWLRAGGGGGCRMEHDSVVPVADLIVDKGKSFAY